MSHVNQHTKENEIHHSISTLVNFLKLNMSKREGKRNEKER